MLLGLAETAVVPTTLGRVEAFFNAVVDIGNWNSRRTTIVSLRFIGVALALCAAATPVLLKAHLLGEGYGVFH